MGSGAPEEVLGARVGAGQGEVRKRVGAEPGGGGSRPGQRGAAEQEQGVAGPLQGPGRGSAQSPFCMMVTRGVKNWSPPGFVHRPQDRARIVAPSLVWLRLLLPSISVSPSFPWGDRGDLWPGGAPGWGLSGSWGLTETQQPSPGSVMRGQDLGFLLYAVRSVGL